MIDYAGALGGAERFVIALAMHLPRDRIEVCVCSTRQGDARAVQDLVDAGLTHMNIGRRAKWDVHRFGALMRFLRRQRFDVLHAHKFGSNVWGTLIGRACRIPVIIAHEHTWSYTADPVRRRADGWLIGTLATRFIAVSEADRRRMIAVEGVAPAKTLVVPTAYIPHPTSHTSDIRAELNLGEHVPLVGAAAIFRKQKALDVLLEAHSQLLDRVGAAHLVIAGDGPCRAELEEHIRRLGIGGSVHLLGLRRDVDAILRRVDVGALSSDWEGMPLFVFECMATKTPLVATAVGGLPEVIEHGVTGLLVPPRDPRALSQALASLLTDRPRAEQIAAAAGIRVKEFTIDAIAGRFAAIYEQLYQEKYRAHDNAGQPTQAIRC